MEVRITYSFRWLCCLLPSHMHCTRTGEDKLTLPPPPPFHPLAQPAASSGRAGQLTEVLSRTGAVFVEKGELREVLCKPKILPIKSTALQKVESLERAAAVPDAAAKLQQQR